MPALKHLTNLFTSNKESTGPKKFGTFAGVFTPDVLTILGVIMYLRLSWVVGNAGFFGAVIIILLAKSVTVFTGLSMSSITTNIKIGAGGAYSIISKSLGLEAGGSIGIPLFIAQTLSAALYIIGFTEGWLRIFPHQSPQVVATIVWLALLLISYISTQFAIRTQYLIMAIMGISLLAFFFTPVQSSGKFLTIGNFEDAGFWQVFAIFFPAVTGIMAGANMSGDLTNPRRSIPLGTMSAIFITMAIYIGLAWLMAHIGSAEDLRANQMFMVDNSFWGPAVIAGILGATFSSALGSMLGAPRILQALAEQKTVPFSKIFAKKTTRNEPRNAIIFMGIIIEVALLVGNLNMLASLITMFFLITYGMLNLVVFIQQSMKIISFRPTFKIPRAVSFLGAIECIFMMFLIDPIFSVVAIVIIIFLYIWLGRRGLKAEWGDIRGGMFLALAERAARLSIKFPRHQISWKPDLLLPVENPGEWSGPLLFIRNICYPSGSLFAVTIKNNKIAETQKALKELISPLEAEGILCSNAVIEDSDFLHGTRVVMQTLQNFAFRPNILFLTLGSAPQKDSMIIDLFEQAQKHELGVILLRQHPRIAFGMQRDVNLWLRDRSPNWHLAMLITLQLQLNWGGKINLITVAGEVAEVPRLEAFLENLNNQARLPSLTHYHVLQGNFASLLTEAPKADINIFGLGVDDVPFGLIRSIPDKTRSSCLFIKDSGKENALA